MHAKIVALKEMVQTTILHKATDIETAKKIMELIDWQDILLAPQREMRFREIAEEADISEKTLAELYKHVRETKMQAERTWSDLQDGKSFDYFKQVMEHEQDNVNIYIFIAAINEKIKKLKIHNFIPLIEKDVTNLMSKLYYKHVDPELDAVSKECCGLIWGMDKAKRLLR
jgi:Zn-dependent M32 family carboxypeptidase